MVPKHTHTHIRTYVAIENVADLRIYLLMLMCMTMFGMNSIVFHTRLCFDAWRKAIRWMNNREREKDRQIEISWNFHNRQWHIFLYVSLEKSDYIIILHDELLTSKTLRTRNCIRYNKAEILSRKLVYGCGKILISIRIEWTCFV